MKGNPVAQQELRMMQHAEHASASENAAPGRPRTDWEAGVGAAFWASARLLQVIEKLEDPAFKEPLLERKVNSKPIQD